MEAEGATADGVSRDDGVERTVRVKVSRLEHMLRLVGEMVLTKHQMHDLVGRLQEQNLAPESVESALKIASEFDRLTLELQVSVMRPHAAVGRLFGRYPASSVTSRGRLARRSICRSSVATRKWIDSYSNCSAIRCAHASEQRGPRH